jgi:hypothetical protein
MPRIRPGASILHCDRDAFAPVMTLMQLLDESS